jgi:hypothetical protein
MTANRAQVLGAILLAALFALYLLIRYGKFLG